MKTNWSADLPDGLAAAITEQADIAVYIEQLKSAL